MADQSLKETPKTQSNPQTQVQGQNQQPKQKTVKLIIKRQDNSESKPYEESFEIPYKENLNVIACLMEIRRNPVNSKGENDTSHMGYELPRRSMWRLFNGNQRPCTTIMFSYC